MAAATTSELSVPMLNCGMCKSLYRDPRMLSCLHTFCEPCLLELPVMGDSRNQAFFRCPQCSRETMLPCGGVGGLVKNHFLARMCQEYVSEVQKTLGGGGGGGGGRPAGMTSPGGQGPASPSSPLLSGGRRSLAGMIHGGGGAGGGVQGSPKAMSPSQSSSFNYDLRRGSGSTAYYSSLSSTTSSDTTTALQQQQGRRPSVEMLPLRARQRKFSLTPPDVLKMWEALQRKLNSLQSASLQMTYSLESVNMTESNWQQRKQDLRREVQRRSAQLQFFIKRQERLLLAMLDSKDTDSAFLQAADRSRDDLRANLMSVVHEAEVVKSMLDLADDSELLTLGNVLLSSTVSQQPVTMEIPELQFKIPDELSVEDKMGQDFGCFTSTTSTREIYTPQVIEQEVVELDASTGEETRAEEEQEPEQEEEEENQNQEIVVTETVLLTRDPLTGEYITTPVSDSTTTTTTTIQQQEAEEEPEPEHREENEEEEESEEEEEEDEEDEEEVIVEETIEIIDGKMQVISSRRVVPTPKPKKEKKPAKKRAADKNSSRKKREGEEKQQGNNTKLEEEEKPETPSSGRGRDTNTRRTANSSAASPRPTASLSSAASDGRTDQAAASTVSSMMTGTVNTQQTLPTQGISATSSGLAQFSSRSSSSSSNSIYPETSRPSAISIGTSSYSTRHETQNFPRSATAERAEEEEEKQPAQEVDNAPLKESQAARRPSVEHQSTLNKFQSFRESLKQRRRELLGSSLGPGQLGMASFLSREKRVQSLDRRASLRELTYRPPSPEPDEERGAPHRNTAALSHIINSSSGVQGSNNQGSVQDRTSDPPPPPAGTSTGPLSPTERTSRPVRRAVSAASDKASKMEFLRETWKKRKEILIQNEAYITPTPGSEDREGGEEGGGGGLGQEAGAEGAGAAALAEEDPHRSRVAQRKARSRITDVSQALTGSTTDNAMEPVLPTNNTNTLHRGGDATPSSPPSSTSSSSFSSSTVDYSAESQAMKTVDKILQKKNVPVPVPVPTPLLSPRSPTTPPPTSPRAAHTYTHSYATSPTRPSKPSMVVRPRPRDPPSSGVTTITTTTTTTTTSPLTSPTADFVPTPLETLPEDETKASPERKRGGLRASSPSRGGGEGGSGKDSLQQVRASIRRKKERWRSLSLT
ncbi:uncharacterized protein LOC143276202 [Babylonia areolata]|uniref:uncharacterized protein LOC143276202 n=1 Tax=Babylonia areolata TaxID=304850 RepID=UPI003FCEFDD6